MYLPIRRMVLSYGIAAAGVVLAGLSHWWLAPVLGDTPPVRLLLVAVVVVSAWMGGLGPGLFATGLGLLAIVAANDSPGDVPGLVNRLVRFGSLGLLLTLLFKWLHALRERAEIKDQDLRRIERRYRQLVEIAGQGIWAFGPDGRTNYANPHLGEMLGVRPEELVGHALSEYLIDEADAQETWNKVADGGAPVCREVRLRARDGALRNAIVTARPIGPDEAPAGEFVTGEAAPGGLLLMVTDITDRKRGEEELRAAKELAEAACQAKDRFIAVLSHELRTPLTPVLYGVSSLLESNPSAEVRPTLEMIHRNIELEARLIDDLLNLSRLSRGRMRLDLEIIDIHEAIRRAIEICRDATFVAGLDVVTDLSAAHHHVTADHARVMQIIWNLIHNAAKFTPPNGRLTIRTSNLSDPTAKPADQPPLIAVDLEDTGIGIDPAVLPRIFEAFEQYHDDLTGRAGGLGLGLAISRSLAEALGGRLLASSPGRGLGSTFRLELSAVAEECVPAPAGSSAAPAAAPGEPAGRSDLRILVVEDNMDTLRYLATVLRQRGHDVVTADRVATARAAVDEAKVPFDLLLSDIELPDGDGLYLMRELGARGQMRGIAVSGFGAEEDRRQSREAGFSDHLTKPVDLNRLEAAIHRATAADRVSQTSS